MLKDYYILTSLSYNIQNGQNHSLPSSLLWSNLKSSFYQGHGTVAGWRLGAFTSLFPSFPLEKKDNRLQRWIICLPGGELLYLQLPFKLFDCVVILRNSNILSVRRFAEFFYFCITFFYNFSKINTSKIFLQYGRSYRPL